MAGWRAAGWRDGWSENAVRLARFDVVCRFARFAVFAVHRGGRFLAVRFRFAVRFTAFLIILHTFGVQIAIWVVWQVGLSL